MNTVLELVRLTALGAFYFVIEVKYIQASLNNVRQSIDTQVLFYIYRFFKKISPNHSQNSVSKRSGMTVEYNLASFNLW